MKKTPFLTMFYFLIFIGLAFSKEQEKLILGTYTYQTNDRLENLRPFSKLAEENFDGQYNVETKSFSSVEELITAMIQNEVDIVFISTAGFLKYIEEGNAYDIAAALVFDDEKASSYRSVIAASRKSGIKDWEFIRNNSQNLRLSLVSENSTSGYLYPLQQLAKQGLIPIEEKFREVEFSKSHKNSLESILTGDSDLAAFGSNDLDDSTQDLIQIIWMSDAIPLGPVLVNKNLDPMIALKVEQLLKGIHLQHPQILESIKSGWVEAQNASRFEKVTMEYYLNFLD
ncbi:phosphate/phosphite/phosphonate ABC transporter substrate-binding protein [Shivajiella indica]|uniref:Phosphate/phosphite/phosphonate ABC transporter substrate-binding protein n=1 Tax=Shivajiella indica TaxID=872115 RepID=A0ABW5BB13_9BACT